MSHYEIRVQALACAVCLCGRQFKPQSKDLNVTAVSASHDVGHDAKWFRDRLAPHEFWTGEGRTTDQTAVCATDGWTLYPALHKPFDMETVGFSGHAV